MSAFSSEKSSGTVKEIAGTGFGGDDLEQHSRKSTGRMQGWPVFPVSRHRRPGELKAAGLSQFKRFNTSICVVSAFCEMGCVELLVFGLTRWNLIDLSVARGSGELRKL